MRRGVLAGMIVLACVPFVWGKSLMKLLPQPAVAAIATTLPEKSLAPMVPQIRTLPLGTQKVTKAYKVGGAWFVDYVYEGRERHARVLCNKAPQEGQLVEVQAVFINGELVSVDEIDDAWCTNGGK